jgi:hypothetical protein
MRAFSFLLTTVRFAVLVSVMIAVGCRSVPWAGEKRDELNLAVRFDRNVPLVDVVIDGRDRIMVVGMAQPMSVLSGSTERPTLISLGGRRSVTVTPAAISLPGVADGILGYDAWEGAIITIDYQRSLMSIRSRMVDTTDQPHYRYTDLPRVPITVDGRHYLALVDTSLPDTLLLPGRVDGRREAKVALGGMELSTDIRTAPVSEPRIGTRLLQNFLVTIDTRRHEVLLWQRE